MILVDFNPDALTGAQKTWWDAWTKRAHAAVDQARKDFASGTPHDFRQQIWRDLKDWLKDNVFEGKCAYCECVIEAGFYGDAEHYRPKGAVTHQGTAVTVNGVAHPGYYWLAYHWKNLVPSCQLCNSGAKGTEFSVEAQYVVDDTLDPDALDAIEKPRLLHPYGPVDPMKYLVFTEFDGGVAARDDDPRATETIRLCGLDRDSAKKWRRREQEVAWREYLRLANEERDAEFNAWARKQPYSAAMIQYVDLKVQEMLARRLNPPGGIGAAREKSAHRRPKAKRRAQG